MPTKYKMLIRNDDVRKVGWSNIICLDTEGAINELTIIDGNEKVLFNGLSADDIYSEEGKAKIQKILYSAYFIVGYSVNCDLRNLSDLGFKIARDTQCLDARLMVPERLPEICNEEYETAQGNYTLKAVAQKLSLPLPSEGTWHQSKFDALVTLRLFKRLQQGYLYAIGLTTPAIGINKEADLPAIIDESKESLLTTASSYSSNTDNVESAIHEVKQMAEKEWKNTELKDYGNDFCEALLYKEGEDDTILVRLSKFESGSLYTIREINPAYSLASFYFDIILPGRKVKIEKAMEEEKAQEEEASYADDEFTEKPECVAGLY